MASQAVQVSTGRQAAKIPAITATTGLSPQNAQAYLDRRDAGRRGDLLAGMRVEVRVDMDGTTHSVEIATGANNVPMNQCLSENKDNIVSGLRASGIESATAQRIAEAIVNNPNTSYEAGYSVRNGETKFSDKVVMEFNRDGRLTAKGVVKTYSASDIETNSGHSHADNLENRKQLIGDMAAIFAKANIMKMPVSGMKEDIDAPNGLFRLMAMDENDFRLERLDANGNVQQSESFDADDIAKAREMARAAIAGTAQEFAGTKVRVIGTQTGEFEVVIEHTFVQPAKVAERSEAEEPKRTAYQTESVRTEEVEAQDLLNDAVRIAAEKFNGREGMADAADALDKLNAALTPALREHLDTDSIKARINEISMAENPAQGKSLIRDLVNGVINKAAEVKGEKVQEAVDKLRQLSEDLDKGFVSGESAKIPTAKIIGSGEDALREAAPDIDAAIVESLAALARESAMQGALKGQSIGMTPTAGAALATPKATKAGQAERTPVIAEEARQATKQDSANVIAIDTNIPNYKKIVLIYQLKGYEVCNINGKTDEANAIAERMETVKNAKGYNNVRYFVLLDMQNSYKAVNLLKLFERIVIGIKGERTDIRTFLREAAKEDKIVITDRAIDRAIKDIEKANGVVIEDAASIEAGKTDEQILNEELTNLAY